MMIASILCDMGYIVATLDNRGTANRGIKFESYTNQGFGKIEMDDNLKMIEYLIDKYPQIDAKRIVTYGHSYGGYLSVKMLAFYPKIISAAISMACVYDWNDYVKYYRERYLE